MSPWIPRVAAILFILFVSLFALDAFSGEASVLVKLGGFLMHLVPSFVLLAILALAWKRPGYGGAAFVLAGILFTLAFDTHERLSSFLSISVPPFVIGAMFIASGVTRRRRPI